MTPESAALGRKLAKIEPRALGFVTGVGSYFFGDRKCFFPDPPEDFSDADKAHVRKHQEGWAAGMVWASAIFRSFTPNNKE